MSITLDSKSENTGAQLDSLHCITVMKEIHFK